MEAISRLEERLDRIQPSTALWINAALFGFVLLAHGGALLLSRTSAWRGPAPDPSTAYFTVPISLLALGAGLYALVRPAARPLVLKVQAAVLFSGAIALAGFGIWLALFGAPPGTPVRWNPVFFGFCVVYPVWLMRTAFSLRSRTWCLAPRFAAGLSILISAAVFWRILGT